MTAIRFKAKGLKEYQQDANDAFSVRLERARISYDILIGSIKDKRSAIVPNVDKFKYPIIDYPEFQQNKYINGRLESAAKGLYADTRNDMELKHLCFQLVGYAVDLRKIVELEKEIELCKKILALSPAQYKAIIKTYYEKVQRFLILDGYGYRFEGKLGWLCFNRVLNTGSKICDFQGTRRRREQLIAEGKQIWNKDEAEFCEKNGIPYDAVDPRVYRQPDAWYEFCLCQSHIPNGKSLKVEAIDYRDTSVRKLTNAEIVERCHGNTDEIMNISMGLKVKLTLCLDADKTLYTKYIRNEGQTKSYYAAYSRQS